jgi:Tfp pilus assembly protein PilN
MNPAQNKTFGIDVCKNFINVVRLERHGEKIILAESLQIPFDAKTVSPDAQTDPKALAGIIKGLKLTKRLEHCDAAVCLGTSPDLLQILKLPETTPHNMIKYIHDEIRQYAVLPIKNIKMDYCALRSTLAASDGRQVLVGACPAQPLVDTVRELEKHHTDIGLIEPAIVSVIRACYRKIVCMAHEKNTMLALLADDTLHICVFNGQKLDFLRTKKIEADSADQNAYTKAIAEQIVSVVQFYELEKTQHHGAWQIFLSCRPNSSQAVAITEQLKNFTPQNIEINPVLPEHLNIVNKTDSSDFSVAAVGAAMKLLKADDSEISLNMIPDEISEIRKSYKQLLVILDVAAAIFVLMFIYIAQLGIQSSKADLEIAKRNEVRSVHSLSQLSRAKADVNEQTSTIRNNLAGLEKIVPADSKVNWAYVLAEVSKKVPQTVQIQSMQSSDSQTFTIEGVAVNYSAVTNFIERLSECKTIASAQLEDTKQNAQYGQGFVDYSITCSLASGRREK